MVQIAQFEALYNIPVFAYGAVTDELLIDRDIRYPTLSRTSISTSQLGLFYSFNGRG